MRIPTVESGKKVCFPQRLLLVSLVLSECYREKRYTWKRNEAFVWRAGVYPEANRCDGMR